MGSGDLPSGMGGGGSGDLPSGMTTKEGVAAGVVSTPVAIFVQAAQTPHSLHSRSDGELSSGMDGRAAAAIPNTKKISAVEHFSAAALDHHSGEISSGMGGRSVAAIPHDVKKVSAVEHFSATALGSGVDEHISGMVVGKGAWSPKYIGISPTVAELAIKYRTGTSGLKFIPIGGVRELSARLPKVSFAMCSYDRPDLLRAAVGSLQSQTDGDWELLLCDDFSTNSRVEEVLRWAIEDKRVRAWRTSRNINAPAILWNFLLDRARGKYFATLDDDNEKLPKFVEVMAGALDADPGLDFVTCGFLVMEDAPMPTRRVEYFLNLSTTPANLDQASTCDGGAILYRRETFERAGYFSEDLRTCEDWDWLRRASRGRFTNLHECYSTYRIHHEQRMTNSQALGVSDDIVRVKGREITEIVGVRAVRPPSARLTESQEDAITSIDEAVKGIQWVKQHGDEIALVFSPFQLSDDEIKHGIAGCKKVVSIHIEDPYALRANVERVKALSLLGVEVWVATNDAGVVGHYQEIVGGRVVVCPLLGVNERVASEVGIATRDIDVLFCGYAYPSRKKFITKLLPELSGKKVILVGNGWDYEKSVETLPTQGLIETYRLHARARSVVCLHRTYGDCSDGPVSPQTVNRGYMEGYFGGRVFIDRGRTDSSIDFGDVVFYDGVKDLAGKINEYFSGSSGAADRHAKNCRLLYSYRSRIARIINCVRAPRYLAVIP